MENTTHQNGTRNAQGLIIDEKAVQKHADKVRDADTKAAKNFAKPEHQEIPLNERPKEIQEAEGVVLDVTDKKDPMKAVKGY